MIRPLQPKTGVETVKQTLKRFADTGDPKFRLLRKLYLAGAFPADGFTNGISRGSKRIGWDCPRLSRDVWITYKGGKPHRLAFRTVAGTELVPIDEDIVKQIRRFFTPRAAKASLLKQAQATEQIQ